MISKKKIPSNTHTHTCQNIWKNLITDTRIVFEKRRRKKADTSPTLEYTSNYFKKNRKITTCNQLWTWKTLRATIHNKPRALTTTLWEPKRKCRKAAPRHFQHHAMWPWALNQTCSVNSFVTGPSIKCCFNEFQFTRVLTHDQIE